MNKRYMALLDERAKLVAESAALFAAVDSGERELTDETRRRDDEINARLTVIAGDIDREERRREWERTVAPAEPGGETGITHIHDRAVDRPWGHETGHGFGEFLQAIARARTGQGTDVRLLAAAQGAGEASGADGGFLVPKTMGDDILLRVYGGELLSRVRRQTLTIGNEIELNVVDETSRATGSRHGAVQGYWVDEGTAPSATRPKFAKVSYKPRKVAALGYASDELLADASLLQTVMFDAFVDELQFLTEDAIVNGTGAGQPNGILGANCLISVSKETGQAAATVVFENILKMWARMYGRSRASAVWLINQDIEPQLYSMSLAVGVGGVPVYLPASGAAGSPLASLMGRPVVPVEYCATLGTLGDVILADLSEYWLFDKGAPNRASSIHVAFTTDETAFRATYRVDGSPRWRSALTPFKGAGNTQSPFVALATRA